MEQRHGFDYDVRMKKRTRKRERAAMAAAAAVRDLKAGYGFDYSYVVTDTYIELATELPEIDWLPLTLIPVLQKWNAAAIAGGFPGLPGVRAPLNASALQLVGLVSSERIRLLVAAGSLRAFNDALEAAGLRWLTIGVDVREGGDMLWAAGLSVDDGQGHVAGLQDVPVVSKRRPGEWLDERLVERLVEQSAEQKQAAETGSSGER